MVMSEFDLLILPYLEVFELAKLGRTCRSYYSRVRRQAGASKMLLRLDKMAAPRGSALYKARTAEISEGNTLCHFNLHKKTLRLHATHPSIVYDVFRSALANGDLSCISLLDVAAEKSHLRAMGSSADMFFTALLRQQREGAEAPIQQRDALGAEAILALYFTAVKHGSVTAFSRLEGFAELDSEVADQEEAQQREHRRSVNTVRRIAQYFLGVAWEVGCLTTARSRETAWWYYSEAASAGLFRAKLRLAVLEELGGLEWGGGGGDVDHVRCDELLSCARLLDHIASDTKETPSSELEALTAVIQKSESQKESGGEKRPISQASVEGYVATLYPHVVRVGVP